MGNTAVLYRVIRSILHKVPGSVGLDFHVEHSEDAAIFEVVFCRGHVSRLHCSGYFNRFTVDH